MQKKVYATILALIICLSSCSNKNEIRTRDVLYNVVSDTTDVKRIDSIVLEYTRVDTVTEFVRRIFYSPALVKPDTVAYKLINMSPKAYLELTYDNSRSIYLNIETFEPSRRSFFTPTPFLMSGILEYQYNRKDTSNNNYYVFRGNDIAFMETESNDGHFYFDSIFHLKKIYNGVNELLFSVK